MTKRILTALLAALLALCTLAPALAETPEATPDITQLYPAAPITLAEYTALYTSAMEEFIDPAYGEYAVWHLAALPDGTVVLTDGIHSSGTYVLALTVEVPYAACRRRWSPPPARTARLP